MIHSLDLTLGSKTDEIMEKSVPRMSNIATTDTNRPDPRFPITTGISSPNDVTQRARLTRTAARNVLSVVEHAPVPVLVVSQDDESFPSSFVHVKNGPMCWEAFSKGGGLRTT